VRLPFCFPQNGSEFMVPLRFEIEPPLASTARPATASSVLISRPGATPIGFSSSASELKELKAEGHSNVPRGGRGTSISCCELRSLPRSIHSARRKVAIFRRVSRVNEEAPVS
jgi:hypothetical protein